MNDKMKISADGGGTAKILRAFQGEHNARTYQIEIDGPDGQQIDLSGTTAMFYISQQDKVLQLPMTISENSASVTLTNEACKFSGDLKCWIQIVKPEAYDLRVDNLILRVFPCKIEEAIPDDGEVSALYQLISDTGKAIQNADQAAEGAHTAAENVQSAVTSASAAAQNANTAAESAQEKAQAATVAAQNADKAASSANTAANQAASVSSETQKIADQLKGMDVSVLQTQIRSKADKLSGGTAGNLAVISSDGNFKDSGKAPADWLVKNDLLSLVYPIGSVYLSFQNASPASFLGGTWEKLEDRFLLGASSSYVVGGKGGEATHTLTVNELPNHNHVGLYGKGVNQCFWDTGGSKWSPSGEWSGTSGDYTTGYTGGGSAHNNMPPYIAVYMWKRIS